MAVLGIDLGARRIGLAVSDPDGRIAFPAGMLESRGQKQDLAALCALIRERGVTSVVVGLPVHMSGRAGPEAEAARRFADELAKAAGVAVELLDERWTSREAERALRDMGRSSKRRERGEVDSLAATLLLRSFLERRERALPANGEPA
jgi:putative Holliday junction resolvase